MNILITNDDGVSAKGIQSLRQRLAKEGHNVYVVAPDTGYSCKSQAISVSTPLRVEKYEKDCNTCYRVKGYPADCIFVALLDLFKNIKFDLIISGINNGANLGFDINYSGTLGAAREGLSYGIPCIAVSYFTHNTEADFTVACDYTIIVIDKLFSNGIKTDCVYSLNIPYKDKNKIKGICVCPMSNFKYFNGLKKYTDPFGKDFYFISGEYNFKQEKDKDAALLFENYVTLTPLKIDYTEYNELNRLKDIFSK